MADQTPDQPTVNQHAAIPPGSIPDKRRKWITIGIAAIVILIIYTAGPPTNMRPKPVASPGLEVRPATRTQIEQGSKELQDALAMAALERDKALRAKTDYTALNRAAEGIPGQAVVGPNGQVYHPYQPQEQLDPLEQAMRKKEFDSLFASNVVQSNRKKEDPITQAKVKQETWDEAGAKTFDQAAKEETPKVQPKSSEGHKLFEGTLIEGVLTNRLEGSFVGPVNCIVSADVYSHENKYLLIPKGTRILGEAKAVSDQDQRRLAVVFHRMIMPDGYSVNLDKPIGLNQEGGAALKDKVNRHYMSTFGTSIMLGLLAGFSMYGTQGIYQGNATDIYRQGVSSQLGRDATRILQRQLNRMPEITIREGHRVKILLSADLSLPAYDEHPPINGL
jgi:type IV secretory pathway VirB10-like protein